ncbi:putative quinone oxidoreductase [Heterostelium album PN500]|uniref:Putative quinone oxidoreductase n=1 Tax=Heterostelium pallidum (strain ATCC 26659 / Pp 5 / PN500) TaxID=670386 RepID=D3BL52_HETP5|nr:putative quinone oxidoreductase [Heterostelium album PN500]EFA77786.1 putative quinone oxidoreductase [Heterostelium album PN500]|eukprot:XP_020429914.1 putative quinone oxidoreductase [Heterostelium album PN500]
MNCGRFVQRATTLSRSFASKQQQTLRATNTKLNTSSSQLNIKVASVSSIKCNNMPKFTPININISTPNLLNSSNNNSLLVVAKRNILSNPLGLLEIAVSASSVKQFGGVEQLIIGQIAKPVPKKNELLVRVKAFAINRADILQRLGKYPPPAGESEILGLEMSGVVESVDSEHSGKFKVGDKVYALVGGGAYGQFCTVDASNALHVPDHLNFEKAAAIPEAWLTAYQAMYLVGNYKRGNTVMVHAAASGVGTALIQLAKEAGAPIIIGTAGSDEKTKIIKELGCTNTINYKNTPSFATEVESITSKRGVDNVFDYVGANYWNDNMKSLALDGTMVIQGTLSGPVVKENAIIGTILQKRLTIRGSTLRSRSTEYKADLIDRFDQHCTNLFANGTLKPIIDRVFNVDEIQEAHKFMEGNHNIGKIVVRGFDD